MNTPRVAALAIASAAVSGGLLVVWWGSLVAGSALSALGVDVVVLAVALWQQRRTAAVG